MRRKIAVLLAALMLAAVGVCCFGCKNDSEKMEERKTMLAGFEDYYDMQKIRWTNLMGEAVLNENREYVTEGEKSCRFTLAYDYQTPQEEGDRINGLYPELIFRPELYDQKTQNIENISSFCIDIYNDNDREIEVILFARDQENKILFTAGRVLASKAWNKAQFPVKNYFYPNGKSVKTYSLCFFDDCVNTVSGSAFYLDNCYVVAEKLSAPEKVRQEHEILSFADPVDAMLVNSVTSEGGIPGFYAEYTPERIFGESGCLKIAARMAKTSIYDIPSTAPDYLLQVYSAALDEIPAVPKAVTFRAFNDGKSDRFVTIIAENGHGRIRERVKIAPGEKKSVEILDFEPLGGKRIEKLYIGVEMWNLIGRSDLYVSGLCFE